MNTLFFVFLLALPLLAAQELTVSGVVKDSLTGAPIEGVKVLIESERCSTNTDAVGRFSLSIIRIPVATAPVVRPFYQPREEVFQTFNLSGKKLGIGGQASGILLSAGGKRLVVAGLKSADKSYLAKAEEKSVAALAKSLAENFTVSFAKDGYRPATAVLASEREEEVRLSPTGVRADVTIDIKDPGQTDVTVEYNE